MSENILEVKNLNVYFNLMDSRVHAIRNYNLLVKKSEIVAVVGESGCGKSVSSKSIVRLIPSPPGEIKADSVLFAGHDMLKYSDSQLEKIRGKDVSVIFQNPMTSLNPVFTIGEQIADVILHHSKMTKEEADKKVIELLQLVKIPNPVRCADSYPHQFSGGMLQRALIAMAFASPDLKLIIADEPTTALDVTVQSEILRLILELKNKMGTSFIFITHDMGIVVEIADRVVVMYGGSKVEEGNVEEIIISPKHPYTQALVEIAKMEVDKNGKLKAIGDTVPNLATLPSICPFQNRCPIASAQCRESFPQKKEKNGHMFYCHNVDWGTQ